MIVDWYSKPLISLVHYQSLHIPGESLRKGKTARSSRGLDFNIISSIAVFGKMASRPTSIRNVRKESGPKLKPVKPDPNDETRMYQLLTSRQGIADTDSVELDGIRS